MNKQEKSTFIIMCTIGLLFIVWLAFKIAPFAAEGISGMVINSSAILTDPFDIYIVTETPKTIILFVLAYSFSIGVYTATKRNYRKGEEHGSAKWGDPTALNRKYKEQSYADNKLLTQNIRIGFNTRTHLRNLNTLVCGGSGSGKTRYFVKPNVMQCNTSYVILDPKGEILRDTGHLLEKKGYKIFILDLINMEQSLCYNPFIYLDSENDVQRLVTNLFKSTTPKDSQIHEPFWDNSASMLLLALVFYLRSEAPEEEQNFEMVMELLRAGEVREENENYVSILDELFFRLEMKDPESIALKYYRTYHTGSAKTLKSVQITLASRLDKFNLGSLANLTRTDEMDLKKLGTEKTAIFALIPDNDTSFNFLVSILYTQLFQQLFYTADREYEGSLPVHVHFLLDEFPNVSLPEDFDKILSVMRSRNISVSIIIQNMAQLKALFDKAWESIVGNCDEYLYLGGNELSTHKYVSEMIGKETIDTNTYGKSTGLHGNYTTNYQNTGRDLMAPDEVRLLDNRYSILFIRGEKPLIDLKYNLNGHPNIDLTPDGGAVPYSQNRSPRARTTIELVGEDTFSTKISDLSTTTPYELFSNEEIEDFFFSGKDI